MGKNKIERRKNGPLFWRVRRFFGVGLVFSYPGVAVALWACMGLKMHGRIKYIKLAIQKGGNYPPAGSIAAKKPGPPAWLYSWL